MKRVLIIPFAPILQGKLTYLLPSEMEDMAIGTRVLVPLGHRHVPGLYAGEAPEESSPFDLKTVLEVLDPFPVLPAFLFPLLEFAAWYYRLPLGMLVRSALPPPLCRPQSIASRTLGKILRELESAPSPGSMPDLPPLTRDQAQAFSSFAGQSRTDGFSVQVLNGVTGSGKTRLYQEMILQTLSRHKQVLVLTPEIGLTPPLLGSMKMVDPRSVSIHSKQADGERLRDWIRILHRKINVVVGPRSSFFAPLPDLGLVIVDEEHDPSYQSREGLSFSVRSLAIKRAQIASIPVILGSATPLLESWHQVKSGRYISLQLPNRVGNRPLPTISVVAPDPKGAILPVNAVREIQTTLDRGEQVVLLLNRRGFVPTYVCLSCRAIASCKQCSVHLVLHKSPQRLLVCHTCQSRYEVIKQCPACGGQLLSEEGVATQKLEEVLKKLFPDKTIARIDGDVPVGGVDVASLNGDLLIGTQMIAKGHDFRNVTLGIILETDRMLSLPDYRSEERAFELIIQLAGRVGRHLEGGKVLLLSKNPGDPIFSEITRYDMESFYTRTSQERQELLYPPHYKIALISLWSRSETAILKACSEHPLERAVLPGVTIQGPVPAPVTLVRGKYHYQFLVRSRRIEGIHQAIDKAIASFSSVKGLTLQWSVDPPDLF